MSDNTQPVLCFGEVLWDCLPRGLFLGGAPVNVAYHLQQLGASVLPVSAVGDDFLGREILRRLQRAGLDIRLVRTVADHPTGVVMVDLDEQGHPSYEIVENVAWDSIPAGQDLTAAAAESAAIVFGSLAQRSSTNRTLLLGMLELTAGLRCFDVNLRKPHDDATLVSQLASYADLLKLNDDEARQLTGDSDAPLEKLAKRLAKKFGCERVCITAGAEGAGLLSRDRWHWCDGAAVTVRDTVGAGDAFMAGLVDGLLRKAAPDALLRRATQLAGFVAASDGAMPDYADAPAEARELPA